MTLFKFKFVFPGANSKTTGYIEAENRTAAKFALEDRYTRGYAAEILERDHVPEGETVINL